jgi:methylated-DNA-[protein]-cysteine S-methyltransferase
LADNSKSRQQQITSGRVTDSMTFNERVWTLTSRVPPGKVTTYGEIARKLGTNGFRAVGNALNRNPYAPEVPCHRVVGGTGALTGFAGGLEKKMRLLINEGVAVRNGKVDLKQSFLPLT